MNNTETQENILNNATEPANVERSETNVLASVEAVVSVKAEEHTTSERSYANQTREDLVAELRKLLVEPILENIKTPVETIKLAFYKRHKEANSLIEEGQETLEKIVDKVEEEFKELLAKYKAIKASINAELAEQKEKNLKLKQEILTKLEDLTNSTDDLSTTIPAFRKLQQEWKQIGQVPQTEITELWKSYNKYQEKFYDLIKINNELREYDFKKNLELKNVLIATAEKLEGEPNALLAFETLQKLHDEWREVGPVAKEEREAIWNRFKEASTKINKKHQSYFESVKAKEEENLKLKTDICQKIEDIDTDTIKTRRQWDEKSTFVIALQEEWKTIGFATKKANNKIFRRFRDACDKFFKAKNSFYKSYKEELSQNLAKRKNLLQRAEDLKEHTNWKEASEIVKNLQKEWRTIGISAKKHTDEIWEKFSAACDYVFEQKNLLSSEAKSEENNNLNLKKSLIVKINEFIPTGNRNEDVAAIKEITAEFDKVGFVPIKEKKAINIEFRNAVDDKFDIVFDRKSRNNKEDKALTENQNKYLKEYETLKKEIASYENNILFLNSSSKKGNSLVEEMNKKVEALKEKLSKLSEKLK